MPRPKGSGNKRTNEFRAILHSIRFDLPREAARLYPSLSPAMKFKMLEYLTPYCYPKLFAKVVEEDDVPEALAESTEALLALADNENQHVKKIQDVESAS